MEASQTFRRFRQKVRGEYKQALLEAVHGARRIGVRENEIVAASVFTTQNLTAILENIRDQIKAATPQPADFNLGPGGARTVFPLKQGTGITFNPQTRVDGTPVPVRIDLLDIFPGVVGTVAFGKYNSPDYEVYPGEFIPPIGTRTGRPTVRGMNEITSMSTCRQALDRGPQRHIDGRGDAGAPLAGRTICSLKQCRRHWL